jgi:CNT family concentrative nucleoside transporter
MISKVMIPETGQKTSGTFTPPEEATSSMDALTQGTVRGVKLFLNVVAMLVVLVALVHLLNMILGLLPSVGGSPVTLQRILGLVLSPVVWAIGIPWNECLTAAELLGTKTILNELFAYIDLSKVPQEALSERSSIIMVYAMCGFANPGSLGIMIGGLGTMVPSRRNTIAELGLRSIIAGTMATCMTGAIVGLIL